jgi:hypothetical protein
MMAGYNGFGGPNQRFGAATRMQLTNATLFRGSVPVSPTRASYQFSNRQAVANPRFAPAGNRQFFQEARYQAAAPQQGTHGVPPNLQRGYSGRSNSPRPSNGGWQRFGDPGSSNTYRQGFTGGQERGGGWHRFGEPQQAPPSYRQSAPNNNGSRPNGQSSQPGWRSNGFNGGSYGGGRSGYNAPQYSMPTPQTQRYSAPPSMPRYNSAPSTPRYSAPSAPRYSAPSSPRFSAPPSHGGGGGGGSNRGGGGGGGGDRGHSSSGGGHRGR